MKQEEKELLIKDLCARLPYNVMVRVDNGKYVEDVILRPAFIIAFNYWDIKPYLRPLNSMTEEEKNELFQLMGNGTDIQRVDFYNTHHFDYRGLIPMGLALEAPEGMYDTKTE